MAKAKKDMTPKERREQMIKDRAARLARDAEKQGITPAELAKKKKDTYVKVLGGAASLLPIGRIVSMASKVIKGGTTAKTAAKTSRAVTTTAKPKPKSGTGTAVATRPSTAVKTKSTAVGPKKPSTPKREMKNITPTKAPATRTKITPKPPKKSTKPVSKAKAAATVAATTALGAAALMGNKGQKKTQAATVKAPPSRPKRASVTGPKPRPKRNAPNYGLGKKDSKNAPNYGLGKMPKKAANKVPSTKSRDKDGEGTGKINLPAGAKRTFGGSYNSKKEKLRNIGGKTYVFNK